MFDQIAERYDLLNDVLSLGQDRLWRRVVAAAVAARPGERVLDLAAGTGTSSRTFTTAGAYCVACDFSLGMLQVGARKAASGRRPDGPATGPVRFAAGDALALPFRDGAFDAVTISFGLRNVADPDAALAEMLRVTRPGGRLVICEFGHLPAARLDDWYGRYLSYRPAGRGPAAVPVRRRLRVPGRVDQGMAAGAGTGQADGCGRMVGDTLAEPDARGGDRACGAPPGVTMRSASGGRSAPDGLWCQGRDPWRHGQRFRLLQ